MEFGGRRAVVAYFEDVGACIVEGAQSVMRGLWGAVWLGGLPAVLCAERSLLTGTVQHAALDGMPTTWGSVPPVGEAREDGTAHD